MRTALRLGLGLLAIAAPALVSARAQAQPVQGTYLYTLSSFTGTIPYNWAPLAVDRERNEVYVLYQNETRIFNEFGMEVYRFGDDLDLGLVIDVAVDERGDVLLLTQRGSEWTIVRCDYRGRPQSRIELTGLPKSLARFAPNRMAYRHGHFYLASTMELALVIADRHGAFVKSYDLFRLFDLEEKDRGITEVRGFSVDREGNILMTVPVLFRAFVLAPDGKLDWFGKPGGAPGRFNIASGIARDSKGNLLVVDSLKGAVQVFDRSFEFVTQFATRGYRKGQLAFPDDLVIDDRDRIYVTQMAERGVSVFALTYPGGVGR